MCPQRQWSEQWKGEREIEQESELARGGLVGLSRDPVGEQQQCGRKDDEVVDSEMRGEENGPAANGLNFVVGIDLVNEFLNDLHLKPEQGRFTAMYLQALDAYEAHKKARALAIFKELNGMHPESVAIQDFVKQLGATPATAVSAPAKPKVTTPVRTEADRTENRRTGHPMAVLMVIGIVVAAILVVVVLANR